MKRGLLILTGALALLAGCKGDRQAAALFRSLENTGIQFVNRVEDTRELNIINYRNFYNGGGVAIGDLNNDGLADVFFTANQGPNQLYLNKGNWQFENISRQAGFGDKKQWSTGVVFADINNDGWLDIYISNAGSMEDSNLRRNQLFINDHHLHFTEAAAEFGLDNTGYTTQASFFDYDQDGDLDCFLINNSPVSPVALNYVNRRDLPDQEWPLAPEMKGGGDHLFRNEGGKFIDVTRAAGIHGSTMSFGLGATVGDVNGDGLPDVYVSNDFYEQDYLYINQGNGRFRDEMEQWMQHSSLASMGADFGDVNNDGYPDIFTTDMLPGDDYRMKTTLAFEDINVYRLKRRNNIYHQFFQNTLQLNNRNGKFADIANYAGVSATDWSWGGLMFDADNDGYSDLYVCNGIYHDLINQDFIDFSASEIMQKMIATGKKEDMKVIIDKMPSIHVLNKMYRNRGNLHFDDVGENWGFSEPSFSNGAAYGDLDNDGDLDLVVSNVNQSAFVYRNQTSEESKAGYIAFQLKGRDPNRFAIGSIVKVFCGDQVLTRELIPSRGFQSSMDYKLVIGLGNRTTIDSVRIQWPDLQVSTFREPAINQLYQLDEEQEKKEKKQSSNISFEKLFTAVPSNFQPHREDDYVDFYFERNVPRMLSREGPKAAVADVNGDGKEDLFIGGRPGQLYLQSATGDFFQKKEPALEAFSDFEDVAVLFFDADGDKDPDLFIGAGGNQAPQGSRSLQHRLFKNDGSGQFTLDASAFPAQCCNTSVAATADVDGDGDADLFVGSRNVPQQYGLTPPSHFYLNDGHGHFSELSPDKTGGMSEAGMVTGASWADMDGDGRKDLVLVGEWMAPQIYTYRNGEFNRIRTQLDDRFGWWQTVAAGDLDGDGREDLVLGNIGQNGYLRPDSAHPVKIFINDFDRNGLVDKVITYTVDGKDKPVFLKHDLEESMPFLKKNNLRHEVYATRSIAELLPAGVLGPAVVKTFNFTPSCIAFNKGAGNFSIRLLPPIVQLSSVNAIRLLDVNADGAPDLVIGGNLFNFQPQLERLDASPGDVLINDGKGNFSWMDQRLTGLELRGELRDLVLIRSSAGNTRLLFLQNEMPPLLMQLHPFVGGQRQQAKQKK